MSFYRSFGKRLFDVTVVIITFPIWAIAGSVVAVVVRIRLGAPITFRQQRAGLAGAPFQLVKFRTMSDCRADDGELLPDARRLSPFGQWLRRTSLDEIPTVLNVLLGHMSLVGPRPLPMRYMPRYSEAQARRHDVRPGLTGLAQVNGRNACSWQERFALDVDYLRRLSFSLDLAILYRTIAVILKQEGVEPPGQPTTEEFRG